MADCASCGAKAGLGKKLCANCSTAEQARLDAEQREARARAHAADLERQAQEQEHQRVLAEQRQARWEQFVTERFQRLEALIDSGTTPYLYDSLRVDSQSFYNESPNPRAWSFQTATGPIGHETDVSYLQTLGLQGWEVTGVIPITFGSTLYNTVGGNTVNAAAYGGLVVGAELILRRPVTRIELTDSRELIIEILGREFPG